MYMKKNVSYRPFTVRDNKTRLDVLQCQMIAQQKLRKKISPLVCTFVSFSLIVR